MLSFGVYEFKSKISELIGLAEIGCTVVVTRNGRPVAWLVPIPSQEAQTLEKGE